MSAEREERLRRVAFAAGYSLEDFKAEICKSRKAMAAHEMKQFGVTWDAAGNGAQGDPATARFSARQKTGEKGAGFIPLMQQPAADSFTDAQAVTLLAIGLKSA